MGIIDQVGPAVTKYKPGDRVVASFNIACASGLSFSQSYPTAVLTPSGSRRQVLDVPTEAVFRMLSDQQGAISCIEDHFYES